MLLLRWGISPPDFPAWSVSIRSSVLKSPCSTKSIRILSSLAFLFLVRVQIIFNHVRQPIDDSFSYQLAKFRHWTLAFILLMLAFLKMHLLLLWEYIYRELCTHSFCEFILIPLLFYYLIVFLFNFTLAASVTLFKAKLSIYQALELVRITIDRFRNNFRFLFMVNCRHSASNRIVRLLIILIYLVINSTWVYKVKKL